MCKKPLQLNADSIGVGYCTQSIRLFFGLWQQWHGGFREACSCFGCVDIIGVYLDALWQAINLTTKVREPESSVNPSLFHIDNLQWRYHTSLSKAWALRPSLSRSA